MLANSCACAAGIGESGREIALYRVSAEESRALTATCLMGYEDHPAEVIAEIDIRRRHPPRDIR
jgi:CRP/FNR family transcriptional regulator